MSFLNKPIELDKDAGEIRYEGKTYNYSPGLIRLLMTNEQWHPDLDDEQAQDDYVSILTRGGYLYKKDGKKAGDRSGKYNTFIKDRLDHYPPNIKTAKPFQYSYNDDLVYIKQKMGSGLKQKRSGRVIDVIVGNAEQLLDQLQLSLASIEAGNTSNLLKNKVIAIADNLFKNGHLKKATYIDTVNHVL